MSERLPWLETADRTAPWPRLRAIVVGGLGVSGYAAADALLQLGAQVVVVDDATSESALEKATLLELLGAQVHSGPGSTARPLADLPPADLLVTSPGLPPSMELVRSAVAAGIPVWGEAELAWRLRDPARPAPWLAVTGTNGKTTTVEMLAAMLRADGRRAVAAGNVGLPLCQVVMDPEPYDVLAVELSSYQLHSLDSLSAESAVVLNVAPDHLTWHGSLADYAAAKAKIYHRCRIACVYNVEDETTLRLVEEAEVVEGCRAVGFTLGVPQVGMVGLVDDVLADRAFVPDRTRMAAELARVSDVPTGAAHNVANALAAAALARAHGVAPGAVRAGLRGFRLDAHRIQTIAEVRGVRYVDDSKATNPHAALASLLTFDPVVWIAGGLAKGAEFDDLVLQVRDRLRAVVLLGADRAVIAAAIRRHAPTMPLIEVDGDQTVIMERVVAAAVSAAQPGDTVLLAPACASQDIFEGYAARGEAFSAAVAGLGE